MDLDSKLIYRTINTYHEHARRKNPVAAVLDKILSDNDWKAYWLQKSLVMIEQGRQRGLSKQQYPPS